MITAATESMTCATAANRRQPGPIRVAVVGCGAIARDFHIPVLAGHENVQLAALVDRDVESARRLAQLYGVASSLADAQLLDTENIDAALIATPPRLHAPLAIDLLRRSIHVLVEKPLAVTLAEAQAMVEAAEQAEVVLAAGYFRRLFPSSRLLKAAIEKEVYGPPLRFDVEEGHILDWPSVTLGSMRKESAGGGVLIDTGSHTLDQLLSFFSGPVELLSYQDDSLGGIEAECTLRLRLHHKGQPVLGRVALSRTRTLHNRFRIECEGGVLELPVGQRHHLRAVPRDGQLFDAAKNQSRDYFTQLDWEAAAVDGMLEPFRAQIDDWLEAIRSHRPLYLSGRSTLPVVQLIEECYRHSRPNQESLNPQSNGEARIPAEAAPALPARVKPSLGRVLITGATGLIGCRAAEILQFQQGWQVRALVHNPGSASRLARLPVEMVLGDLRSPDDMARAVEGCQAVVHCAYGKAWGQRREIFKATVDGTRYLAQAARAAGVRRFVHLSTIAVHGSQVQGWIDEGTPLAPSADDYSESKAEAERVLADAARAGLSTVILRLANVYGPFSAPYTIRPVQFMADRIAVLLGNGETPSNTVFVDNVVEAIAKALTAPSEAVSGEIFTISDGDDISWADFHRYYAEGLGLEMRGVPMEEYQRLRANASGRGLRSWLRSWTASLREVLSSPELLALGQKVLNTDPLGAWPRWTIRRFPWLRKRLKNWLGLDRPFIYRPAVNGQPPLPPLELLEMFSCPAAVRIDKARRQLDYSPVVSRHRAMEQTLDWVRQARLVTEATNE